MWWYMDLLEALHERRKLQMSTIQTIRDQLFAEERRLVQMTRDYRNLSIEEGAGKTITLLPFGLKCYLSSCAYYREDSQQWEAEILLRVPTLETGITASKTHSLGLFKDKELALDACAEFVKTWAVDHQ